MREPTLWQQLWLMLWWERALIIFGAVGVAYLALDFLRAQRK